MRPHASSYAMRCSDGCRWILQVHGRIAERAGGVEGNSLDEHLSAEWKVSRCGDADDREAYRDADIDGLVLGERHLLVMGFAGLLVLDFLDRGQRHDLVVEIARVLGRRRAPLAGELA